MSAWLIQGALTLAFLGGVFFLGAWWGWYRRDRFARKGHFQLHAEAESPNGWRLVADAGDLYVDEATFLRMATDLPVELQRRASALDLGKET